MIYKILGQSLSVASTYGTLYIVPSSTQTVCSTLAICNLGVSTTYRVAVKPTGGAVSDVHHIVYNSTLNQYDSVFLTLGITIASTDMILVWAGTSNVSFNLFGTEMAAATT